MNYLFSGECNTSFNFSTEPKEAKLYILKLNT